MYKIKMLPLSGSERKYTHRFWGASKGINNNNCYAYAIGDYEAYRFQKSIPGDRSGLSNLNHNYTSCRDLPRRVISDNPRKVYKVHPDKPCRKGYYKIMMFVAPGRPTNFIRQGDFHFYVQHGVVEYKVKPGDTMASIARFFKIPVVRVQTAVKRLTGGALRPGKNIIFRANCWSHKRGWATGPLLDDASGKMIRDPRKANRAYPGLKYSLFCSAFCVKNRGIRVGKTHPKVRQKSR